MTTLPAPIRKAIREGIAAGVAHALLARYYPLLLRLAAVDGAQAAEKGGSAGSGSQIAPLRRDAFMMRRLNWRFVSAPPAPEPAPDITHSTHVINDDHSEPEVIVASMSGDGMERLDLRPDGQSQPKSQNVAERTERPFLTSSRRTPLDSDATGRSRQ